MAEENISQEFRLENVIKTRNYFVEKIEQNELMTQKHKKVRTTINYIEHFLILASAVTGCMSSFCFFALYSYKNCEFGNRIKT